MNAAVVPAIGFRLRDDSEIDRPIDMVKQARIAAGLNMISHLEAFTALFPVPPVCQGARRSR